MKIIGHQSQREALYDLLKQNHFPHAILLSGAEGVGKRKVGHDLSRALCCKEQRACNAECLCENCLLFDSGNYPDYTEINARISEDARIDRFRDLLYQLSLRSFSGSYRVVLIDNADALSVQVSNLLLKSLEEPKEGVHFILVASNPSQLPPTLLSRCQIWPFFALESHEMRKILEGSGFFKEEVEEEIRKMPIPDLLETLDGSFLHLEALIQSKGSQQQLSEFFSKIIQGDSLRVRELGKILPDDKESLRSALQFLRARVRAEMVNTLESTRALIFSRALSQLIYADTLILNRNVNATYLLTDILVRLAEDLSSGGFLKENAKTYESVEV